jgi:hypothetical protein
MSKDTHKKTGINKAKQHETEIFIKININLQEKAYFERLASLLSKINLPKTSIKLLPDNSLSALGRMGLGMVTQVYLTGLFIESELAKNLPDKEALNEFVAFRRDYMNLPVDKQIDDLKRVGVVK